MEVDTDDADQVEQHMTTDIKDVNNDTKPWPHPQELGTN